MPWILDEDAAMKALCAGVTVTDEKNTNRPVKAWFGMPDVEVRARSYPFITIDLLGLAEDHERQRSGPYYHKVQYTPEAFPTKTAQQSYVATVPPEAYILTYQVSTWARNPRHDRQMLSALLNGQLPLRWGQVVVGTGAAANIRRLDVNRFDKRDSADSDGKRLFRNVFTCLMSSELFYWQVTAVQNVITANLALTQSG